MSKMQNLVTCVKSPYFWHFVFKMFWMKILYPEVMKVMFILRITIFPSISKGFTLVIGCIRMVKECVKNYLWLSERDGTLLYSREFILEHSPKKKILTSSYAWITSYWWQLEILLVSMPCNSWWPKNCGGRKLSGPTVWIPWRDFILIEMFKQYGK